MKKEVKLRSEVELRNPKVTQISNYDSKTAKPPKPEQSRDKSRGRKKKMMPTSESIFEVVEGSAVKKRSSQNPNTTESRQQLMSEMISENTRIKEKVRVWNEQQKRIKLKNDEFEKLKEEKLKKDQLFYRIQNCIRCKSNTHHHHKRKLETEEHHRMHQERLLKKLLHTRNEEQQKIYRAQHHWATVRKKKKVIRMMSRMGGDTI